MRQRRGYEHLLVTKEQHRALFNDVMKSDPFYVPFNLAKIVALVTATFTLALNALFTFGGTAVCFFLALLSMGSIFFYIFLALGVLFFISSITRPPTGKSAKSIVPIEQCPSLYEFANFVASSLQAKPVDGITISAELNASFSQIGWKRKQFLVVGLPLWEILDNQERVALIAHEVAHAVNGDPLRNWYIRAALNSLIEWNNRVVILAFAGFVAYGLENLLWRNSRRAEYLADYLATTISGTEPMLRLLWKLQNDKRFDSTLRWMNITGNGKNINFFDELKKALWD